MNMPRIFVIDDLRSFRDGRAADYARTSQEALNSLEAHPLIEWDEIWLDHDLGLLANGVPDTIMVVVDYLCERAFNYEPVKVNLIKVHTSNPVGARQMVTSLQRFGYDVQRVQPEIHFVV